MLTRLVIAGLACSQLGGLGCGTKKAEPKAQVGGEPQAKPVVLAEPVAPPASAQVFQGASAIPKLTMSEAGAGEGAEMLTAACELRSNNPTAVIEEAGNRYRNGNFLQAHACARMAVDLAPQAVAAHHLLAAALTGLARYQEAQVSFAMALALDPNDPETLADVADFYINILPPKSRDTIAVGLQYARRGSGRAETGRRFDPTLQARLLLLEAEALNDLGESDLALPRAIEALERAPGLLGGERERAVSLFRLLRFEESEEAFLQVLGNSPDDAYAHHHLGLLYERLGRAGNANAHFEQARRLAPGEFPTPVIVSPEDFQAELDLAVAELNPELRDLLRLAALEVADLPSDEDLGASKPPFSPTILGLYRGLPAGVVADEPGETPPRAVVLYRNNLGRAAHSRSELNRQIRHTLRHEIGHLQGYDEDELRRRGFE